MKGRGRIERVSLTEDAIPMISYAMEGIACSSPRSALSN
jgi:hypothetical protein